MFRQISRIQQNRLLAALPGVDCERLAPHLELVNLNEGQMLCEFAATPTHVYFPTTAIVSLLHFTQAGDTSEIAVVGNEGVVGISLFTDGGLTSEHTTVQTPGECYRLSAKVAKDEVNRCGSILNMLLNYTQTLMAQMAQTAIYRRHHSLEQQVCRRLLLALDRLPSDEMEMTHEVLGDLLGVRRESVTSVAVKLQQAGVIRYTRGHIAILDRGRLEQRASMVSGITRLGKPNLRAMPIQCAA